MKKNVKYVCVRGERIDQEGEYVLGSEIYNIGQVQAIVQSCGICGWFDCDCNEDV